MLHPVEATRICFCNQVNNYIGQGEAVAIGLDRSLENCAKVRDLWYCRCRSCGTFWELVPSSPYWCVTSPDFKPDERDHTSYNRSPLHNRGYIYQKRPFSSVEKWYESRAAICEQRKTRLHAELARYRAEGYAVREGTMSARVRKETQGRGLFAPPRLHELTIAVDFAGRIYWEEAGVRGGQDKGKPWLM